MYEITDKEINWAEDILLPEGASFDKQRRKVIKCLTSKDIIACPGSGKTTTLLAKLLILERKLPLDNNKGICVLTHTNVAIDEIKYKIGNQNSILFHYPNNFSTIQSFVNRYLAIPAYQYFFKRDIYIIDNESYKSEFYKEFSRILRGYRENLIKKAGYSPVHSLLRLDYHEDQINIMWGDKPLEKVYSKKTKTYGILFNLKQKVLQRGILTFQEAFVLAQEYIKTFPEIKRLVSARFKYLFIDEMQDTSERQQQVIQSLFNSDKVVTQFYGDSNQAIYEGNNPNDVDNFVQSDSLSIDNSLRMSQSIANSIRTVCVTPQNLQGNEDIPNVKPTIIKFNEKSIEGVLPVFAELIDKHGLIKKGNRTFKAVGRVTYNSNSERIVIPSYYEHFKRKGKSPLYEADTFNEYINYFKSLDSKLTKDYRKAFIQCFLQLLRHLDIKHESRYFTEKSLIEYIDKKSQYGFEYIEGLMTQWILDLHSDIDIESDIRDYLQKEFLTHFEETLSNEALSNFFTTSIDVSDVQQELGTDLHKQPDYRFLSKNGDSFLINIDTIHGVKGETHTATLYLETFSYGYEFDSGKIIDYLKGIHSEPRIRQKQMLKLAYVGMSRPSHLLCIAIREDALIGHEEELIDIGWDIMNAIC